MAEELESHLNDPAVAFVRELLPSAVVEPDTNQLPGVHVPSYHIHLPPASGADYRFTLWLRSEKQISARLLTSNENEYFWYRPFEEAEFRSPEEIDNAFIRAVKLIVCHNTRIEQRRGLFFNHFQCEYESVDGWKRLYGLSALRWIRAPKIAGRRQVYQSPRLIPDN